MKKFNKSKVIIPALAMIALTTAASATGTVAWFSANTAATVTGMQFTATAGSNLLIASDTLASTDKLNDSNFKAAIEQTPKGDLHPVSTINGTNFYYTTAANADGSRAQGATFSTLTGNQVNSKVGYLDYVFQVKAVNTKTTEQSISFTKVELTYATDAAANPSSPTESETTNSSKFATAASKIKAYRTAVFVEDITSGNPAGGVGTINAIYAQYNAANFTPNNAIKAISNEGATATLGIVDAISNGDGTGYTTSATALATVAAATTKYYKVVVRLWLEGEDTTCHNSAFLGVTKNWNLALSLQLADDTAGAITYINSVVTDTVAEKSSTNGAVFA